MGLPAASLAAALNLIFLSDVSVDRLGSDLHASGSHGSAWGFLLGGSCEPRMLRPRKSLPQLRKNS